MTRPSPFVTRRTGLNHPRRLPQSNFADLLSRFLDRFVAKRCETAGVRIRAVATEADFVRLQEGRSRLYRERDGYLSSFFQDAGYDDVDLRSFVFAAYRDDDIVGSVRMTPAPYEVERYVPQSVIENFLLPETSSSFLEISRLVVGQQTGIQHLASALVTYAGAMSALTTQYKYYVSYARPTVKSRLRFTTSDQTIRFSIPERGSHEYELFKGSFLEDFRRLVCADIDVLSELLNEGPIHPVCSGSV